MTLRIAWRNLWRNPRRSILTMTAIAFASTLLIFMLSWQFGSYETMINASVKIQTGHLQVQAPEYNEDKDMRRVVEKPEEIGKRISTLPGVAALAFRANGFVLASSRDRTYGALIVGIEPEREAALSTLKGIIRQGSYLDGEDGGQALLGELLAENLKVGLGDELTVIGQGRDGSVAATVLVVKGLYRSGQDEFDRSAIHIPLSTFQDVFSMRGSVHEVVILADALSRVPEVKKKAREALRETGRDDLVVLDWRELLPGLVQAIQMDLVSGFIFYVILVVVVAFSILNTFLMAILERTREFGVLLAIGMKPKRLVRLVLAESAVLTFFGIAAGILFGVLLTGYFQEHGIFIPGSTEILRQFGLPERIYPRLSGLSVTLGPVLVFLITLLTALYPAGRVKRLRAVDAMAAP
ncbi:MAG TPA: FtsX-like permease family protein [Syntrophales bacterium]|nr:FtsX-like permease family protein [Syntrophales bacterium]